MSYLIITFNTIIDLYENIQNKIVFPKIRDLKRLTSDFR